MSQNVLTKNGWVKTAGNASGGGSTIDKTVTSTTSPLTDSADDTIKAITLKGNSYKDGDRIIIPSGDVVSQNADKTESSTIHTDRPLLSVNDIRNELIIDKDGNGKFIQRVGKYIFNGNEGWYAHSSGRFYANYLPSGITSERGKDICSIATYVQDATAIGSYYFRGSTGYYFTKVKSDETLDEFKARISNALTVYALATPQEITLTSAEVEQILSLKTFDGNTYIDTDGCPFEITYNVNATIGTLYTKTEDLQKQIDEIPKGEIYSEEETVIGIWVDGSKIYRRMFTNLSPFTINTTKTDITSRFSSMYNIIKYPLRCSAMRENSPFFGDFTLWKDTGNAKLWAYAGQASELANCTTVIFEYTKN